MSSAGGTSYPGSHPGSVGLNGGDGDGTITEITSTGGTVEITNPTGPVVNLEVALGDRVMIGKFTAAVIAGETPTFGYAGDPGIDIARGGSISADNQLYQTSARTFDILRVTAVEGNGDTPYTVTLYKNGAPTAQQITVPASAAVGAKFVDGAHPITSADGDTFDVRWDKGISGDATVGFSATLEGAKGAGGGGGGGTAADWATTTEGNDFAIVDASEPNISPSAPENGANINAWITAKRAAGGAVLFLRPGVYDHSVPIIDSFTGTDSGIQIRGAGPNATFLRAVGSLTTAGDQFTLNQSRGFIVRDLSFTSETTRTAGCRGVVIKGLLAAPVSSLNLQGIDFQDVNLFNQFDGMVLLDSPGGLGVQGFKWTRGYMSGFAAGGNGIDVATPNGEIIWFEDIEHSETPGVPSASRPNCTMRVRAVADMRAIGVESVYCRNGLIVTPGDGMPGPGPYSCNTMWFDRCIWGQITQQAVWCDTTAGTLPNGIILGAKFLNNYVDGTDGSLFGFVARGAGIVGLQCTDLAMLECAIGFLIDGVTRGLTMSGVVLGGCPNGFVAGGNAANWKVQLAFGNEFGTAAFGGQIGLGCHNFNVELTGAVAFATTPLSDLSGAVTKNVVVV